MGLRAGNPRVPGLPFQRRILWRPVGGIMGGDGRLEIEEAVLGQDLLVKLLRSLNPDRRPSGPRVRQVLDDALQQVRRVTAGEPRREPVQTGEPLNEQRVEGLPPLVRSLDRRVRVAEFSPPRAPRERYL